MSCIYKFHNPIDKGLVFKPEDYMYISYVNKSLETGLIADVVIFQFFNT